MEKPTRPVRTRTSLPIQLIEPPRRRGFSLARLPSGISALLVISTCAGLVWLGVFAGLAMHANPSEQPADAGPEPTALGSAPAPGIPVAVSTPEPPERDAQLWGEVDDAWNVDWTRVVNALRELEVIEGRTPRWVDKTYAAYYNYGQLMLSKGLRLEAAGSFSNALQVRPDGEEARRALLALTPVAGSQ
jgi:hypothetical protein